MRREEPRRVLLSLHVDADELVDAIWQTYDRELVFDLIKSLDLAVAEYEFTEQLRDYFAAEMKRMDEEEQ